MIKSNCKSCLSGDCTGCINHNCFCRESHNKVNLIKEFTTAAANLLPNSPDELKRILQNDIDKEKTIDSDAKEFSKDTKGGFYAYEEKNMQQHFSKDFVSNIMLPAHVFNGKESCGKWKFIGCLESDLHERKGGNFKKGIMHCNNKGCKVCATSSIKREAKAITNRLMTFCALKKNRKVYLKKNRSRILSHVVVSIPYEEQSFYLTKEGRKELRAKAIKFLKQFDVDGGVMIDHPYRFSKGLESARFSPHFHFILTGWIDGQIVKEIYEKTGWIISQISTMESWKDCYNLSKYLLSHAAVFLKEESKRSAEHSVRYFGECHNKKFKVEDVLKYSLTGYDQIDSIIKERKGILKYETKIVSEYSKKKHCNVDIKKKFVIGSIPLQSVAYTHSIIQQEIKDVQNEYFEEYINGKPLAFSKSLKRYITPLKDNPAIPQSEPPSMEFLQMRFDYGNSQFDIVQSVYVNIIFDHSLDELCPECSLQMETLTPCDTGWSDEQQKSMADLLVDLPENTIIHIDNVSMFDYLRNTRITHLGMPYFDFDGRLQYDTGIYARPECLDSLNPKLYWSIIRNIDTQKAKYSFKQQNGRCPTKEELNDILNPSKIYKTQSQPITSFLESVK